MTLDDVADVGKFVEVEIVAPEGSRPADRAAPGGGDLGSTETERRSYLEMLLAKKP